MFSSSCICYYLAIVFHSFCALALLYSFSLISALYPWFQVSLVNNLRMKIKAFQISSGELKLIACIFVKMGSLKRGGELPKIFKEQKVSGNMELWLKKMKIY